MLLFTCHARTKKYKLIIEKYKFNYLISPSVYEVISTRSVKKFVSIGQLRNLT